MPLPAYPRLAEACAETALGAPATGTIIHALEEAQPRLEPQTLEAMEKQLTEIGSRQDHDFLVRAAKHWIALLDQEQPPAEEELTRFQGIFPGRRRNGLNHLHIYCTDEQHEALTTLINSAANPRLGSSQESCPVGRAAAPGQGSARGSQEGVPDTQGSRAPEADPAPDTQGSRVPEPDPAPGGQGSRVPKADPAPDTQGSLPDGQDCTMPGTASAQEPGTVLPEDQSQETRLHRPAAEPKVPTAEARVQDRLPRLTRPQLLLEGLLSAVRASLASGGLPASGGLRPQVLVTISHDALLVGAEERTEAAGRTGKGHSSPGIAAFSGPIAAQSVRRIACDADLIPVVLGTKGQVLDLGRAARLFPPHLRRALHARDLGCTFPGCTVPGPWTEAHHVTFWEHGGGTGIANGALLCSFHHHLIHQGKWKIFMRSGVPWFRPPTYVDPDRGPLRNSYFHPLFLKSDSADAT